MKVSLNIDIHDKQLAQLKEEALKKFNEWDNETENKTRYWPTPLELFAIRILLFELKKQ
jgi:hypothetical protein